VSAVGPSQFVLAVGLSCLVSSVVRHPGPAHVDRQSGSLMSFVNKPWLVSIIHKGQFVSIVGMSLLVFVPCSTRLITLDLQSRPVDTTGLDL